MPEQAGPWESYSQPAEQGPWANYAASTHPQTLQLPPSDFARDSQGRILKTGLLPATAQAGEDIQTGLKNAAIGMAGLPAALWQGARHPLGAAGVIAGGLMQTGKEALQVPGAVKDILSSPGGTERLIGTAGQVAGESAPSVLATSALELPQAKAAGSALMDTVKETGPVSRFIKNYQAAREPVDPNVPYAGETEPPVTTRVERRVDPRRISSADPRQAEQNIIKGTQPTVFKDTEGAQETINRDVAQVVGPKEEIGRGGRAAGERIEQLIGEGMGATEPAPNLPIKSGVRVPEGHTAINSSAATSWKYNPDSQSLDIQRPNGTIYRTGEVTPEEWQHLQETESQGGRIGVELHKLHQNHAVIEKAGRPVIPTGPRTFSPNASGESGASLEAMGRQASEKAAGTKRVVIDTRSGQERPLIGPDAADYTPRPHEKVIFRGGSRDGEIIDQGEKAK